MYENMIPALATATRIACLRLTSQHVSAIENAVEQGASFPRRPGWEQKAAAHAEIFSLLAQAVDDQTVARVLILGAEIVRDLAIAAGPTADGIIINSRRRLLAGLRARDAEAAEHEKEEHLRCLHFMWRLTGRRARTTLATTSVGSSATLDRDPHGVAKVRIQGGKRLAISTMTAFASLRAPSALAAAACLPPGRCRLPAPSVV